MATHDEDYYILPSAWCEACARQVTCDVIVWEAAGERLATFICPGCGRPLGVGLRGHTSWSPHPLSPRRGASPRDRGQAP